MAQAVGVMSNRHPHGCCAVDTAMLTESRSAASPTSGQPHPTPAAVRFSENLAMLLQLSAHYPRQPNDIADADDAGFAELR